VRISFAIIELAAHEVNQLLEDKRFSILRPSQCSRCRNSTIFTRRVFQIVGVKNSKQNDNDTQQIISFHFKQRYSIAYVFFKSHDKRFFVDSATCDICKSTAIIYDITLDSELLSKVGRLIGKSEAEVKGDLEKTHKKLFMD
jgi:hypothetical protein